MFTNNFGISLGGIALALCAAATPVRADDDSRWSGFHVGGRLGYGWGDGKTRITPLPSAATFINLAPQEQSAKPNGVLAGAVFGYDWQRTRLVFGLEGDLLYTGMKGTKTVTPITQNDGSPFPGGGNHVTVEEKVGWLGSARFRLGYAPDDSWLYYGTGGVAYGKLKDSADVDFRPVGTEHYPAAADKGKTGWTVGAGTEYAFNATMSLAVDYRYYDLGKTSATADPAIPLPPYQIHYEWKHAFHSVNVGFNWKF